MSKLAEEIKTSEQYITHNDHEHLAPELVYLILI